MIVEHRGKTLNQVQAMNENFPDAIIYIQGPDKQTYIKHMEERMHRRIRWIKKMKEELAIWRAVLCI